VPDALALFEALHAASAAADCAVDKLAPVSSAMVLDGAENKRTKLTTNK
jgi:hypothetical protein